MRFPKERISFSRTYEGHSDADGFVTLDIKGLDIEGAAKLVLRFADIRAATEKGTQSESAAQRLRDLLGDD